MDFKLKIPGHDIVFAGSARHQVAITGRTSNAQTLKPLNGARVEIISSPTAFAAKVQLLQALAGAQWETMVERLDRTRTRAAGYFYFLDLPPGLYTLKASLPGAGSRYGETQVNATVVHDAAGNITKATANLALPATTLKGTVVDAGSEPVILAEARIVGSGEYDFTNENGEYLLASLEKGARTVQVSARGFQTATQAALLSAAGSQVTLNFNLVP